MTTHHMHILCYTHFAISIVFPRLWSEKGKREDAAGQPSHLYKT